MSVRIVQDASEGTIASDELRDGQIAEIVSEAAGCGDGRIIQKDGPKRINQIGRPHVDGFSDGLRTTIRVRVLPNRTLLEVTDNE